MRLIVARAGGPTDTARDYEYTDWEELIQFVDGFLEAATPRP
jgi:menaquinone-dependent protoporphyrinogen oxidase